MTRNERGSVTLIAAASLAFAAILTAFGADVARAIAARGRVQAAADAAALAAAQELIVSSDRSPQEVAAEYAERGGARLEGCVCDATSDEVVVTVALDIEPASPRSDAHGPSTSASRRGLSGRHPGAAGLVPGPTEVSVGPGTGDPCGVGVSNPGGPGSPARGAAGACSAAGAIHARTRSGRRPCVSLGNRSTRDSHGRRGLRTGIPRSR